MPSKILIAHDGSTGAAKALGAAIMLAKRMKAELHMICVEELPRFPTSVDEVIEERLEANHRFADVVSKAVAEANSRHVKLTTHVVAGHAVSSIVDLIERHRFELLVVGYMGHTALYNRLIGGTTDRLVEVAPCSVLVVK
jgi:nucleotide-binding universal stress UspA family protein